jgi:hypothetical protein
MPGNPATVSTKAVAEVMSFPRLGYNLRRGYFVCRSLADGRQLGYSNRTKIGKQPRTIGFK